MRQEISSYQNQCSRGRTNQGHSNLPAGYWVYVYPNWFIWGDAVTPR